LEQGIPLSFTLQDLGALGEFVGAFAVLATLIYLARQVTMSNRLARAEAWRGPHSDITGLNASFGVDPVFRRAMAKLFQGGAERTDFDEDEQIVLDFYFVSITHIYEQLYREVVEGVLKDGSVDNFAGHSLLTTRFFQTSWVRYKRNVDPGFAEYFDEKLAIWMRDRRG
jgi:hypothetical protein